MAGKRGLYGDLGGLLVADFANHHHVRVLTHNGTQATGEGHVHLGVHLGLADTFEVVLDRVFDGEDIACLVVQSNQAGVQRGGLALTRGASDQQDAMVFTQGVLHQVHIASAHPQMLKRQAPRLFIEQTQHHSLAIG